MMVFFVNKRWQEAGQNINNLNGEKSIVTSIFSPIL